MREEPTKLGATVEELPDGLVVHESELRPAELEGDDNHRVVMALAIAATQIRGLATNHGAEAVGIMHPGFVDALKSLGWRVESRMMLS